MSETQDIQQQINDSQQIIDNIKREISKVVIGQQAVVEQLLVTFFSGGHLLLEGVPGLGKTLMVKALAQCFSGQFSRVQFTPDLMPSDITGHSIYNMSTQKFNIKKGPAFTNLLLADEINRAPAKTQAALLEVMQERSITIEGQAFPAGTPFMVLATQNPIEQEGTYPLPEAELDRFMMKVFINYPDHMDEVTMVKQVANQTVDGFDLSDLTPVLSNDDINKIRTVVNQVITDDKVVEYAVNLVRATRSWSGIVKGAGPRACINILKAAKTFAMMQGRSYIIPDDVKEVALPILRHRIMLSAELEIEGFTNDRVLTELLNDVEAPRS